MELSDAPDDCALRDEIKLVTRRSAADWAKHWPTGNYCQAPHSGVVRTEMVICDHKKLRRIFAEEKLRLRRGAVGNVLWAQEIPPLHGLQVNHCRGAERLQPEMEP